jgi:dsDNA-specific endonuclease/ATPase MutS2
MREYLASHPLVSSYKSGKGREGGEGVTIANLTAE